MDLTGFTSLQATVDVHVVLREHLCQKNREKSRLHNGVFADPSVLFSRFARGPDVTPLTAYMVVWQLPLYLAPKNSSQQCLTLGSNRLPFIWGKYRRKLQSVKLASASVRVHFLLRVFWAYDKSTVLRIFTKGGLLKSAVWAGQLAQVRACDMNCLQV